MPMPYESVALAIRRGQVAPCYLLAGPDGLQQREVLQALQARVPELGVHRLDGGACTPRDVAGLLRTPGLVSTRLIVVDEPPWILAVRSGGEEAEEEGAARGRAKAPPPERPLLDYLDAPAQGAVLVLRTAGEVDRRRRLTKRAGERGVLLEAVAPRDNAAWLRQRCAVLELALPPEAFAAVSERLAGATCERMAAELDKLAAYGPGLERAALDLLLPPDRQERIYDLVDAAIAGQGGAALRLAAALLEQGEPVMRLLYSLGSQLRTILLVAEACQGGVRPDAAAAALGLHPFVARKALDQSRRLQPAAVTAAVEAVWEAELGLKSGRFDEPFALDHALLGMLRATAALAAAPRGAGSRPGRGEVPGG